MRESAAADAALVRLLPDGSVRPGKLENGFALSTRGVIEGVGFRVCQIVVSLLWIRQTDLHSA